MEMKVRLEREFALLAIVNRRREAGYDVGTIEDQIVTRHLRKTKKEKHMIRTNVWMKLLTSVLLTAVTAFPQSSDRLPVTDAEKIADALRAGPAFITNDATVLDCPSAPAGQYLLLRRGSNEWTCAPAIPGYPHDEQDSFD